LKDPIEKTSGHRLLWWRD